MCFANPSDRCWQPMFPWSPSPAVYVSTTKVCPWRRLLRPLKDQFTNPPLSPICFHVLKNCTTINHVLRIPVLIWYSLPLENGWHSLHILQQSANFFSHQGSSVVPRTCYSRAEETCDLTKLGGVSSLVSVLVGNASVILRNPNVTPRVRYTDMSDGK